MAWPEDVNERILDFLRAGAPGQSGERVSPTTNLL